MQSLLRWGIENSSPDSSAPTRLQTTLDPGLIDHIMGPSPVQQMQDALAVATDDTMEEGEDEDEEDESNPPKATRMQALGNLEMVRSLLVCILKGANGEHIFWNSLCKILIMPNVSILHPFVSCATNSDDLSVKISQTRI